MLQAEVFSFDNNESWRLDQFSNGVEYDPGRLFCLYMPVIHRGYWELFARYPDTRRLLLVDRDEFSDYAPIKKDVHALGTDQMICLLNRLKYFEQITVLSSRNAHFFNGDCELIIADNEVEDYLSDLCLTSPTNKIIRENVFLRWTAKKALEQRDVLPDLTATTADLQVLEMMRRAEKVGQGSSDFWRQVGAILVLASGEQLTAFNQHLPDSETPYIVGDIRGQFHKGEHWELGSSIHAEAGVIAQAARLGKSTDGATLYVTDFPCPNCAKLIAMAGVQKLYYARGYTVADGRAILEAAHVEVIKVRE